MHHLWLLFILTTSFFFEVSATEFKGDRGKIKSWDNISISSFLSFKEWKEDSDMQDRVGSSKILVKEREHKELVGRIYQCVGSCRIDRGDGFFNGSPRTGIIEGDEIQTVGDSYAWIFLFDGTMVRLSPESSITFNELNIGVSENFINARVNAGNVLWLSRSQRLITSQNLRETDVIFFPYSEYESLPITETKQYKEDDLFELITPPMSSLYQYISLNKKIIENNNRFAMKPTYAFIVMPNATLMGYSPNVEIVSLLGGKSYFKSRSKEFLGHEKNEDPINDLQLQLRGFDEKELKTVELDTWFEVDDKGKSFSPAAEVNWLTMGEFMTKRIPSILIGREIYLSEYSEFAFRKTYEAEALALNDGYLLWGKLKTDEEAAKSNLQLRLDFLKEYFRRIETSNLVTSSRFSERMKERGEEVKSMEYGRFFFITALNRYYQFGEKFKEKTNDKEIGEVLNSTQKLLWKKMHGIR